jgi:hypothetical protein
VPCLFDGGLQNLTAHICLQSLHRGLPFTPPFGVGSQFVRRDLTDTIHCRQQAKEGAEDLDEEVKQAAAYETQVQQVSLQVEKFGALQAKLPMLQRQLESTELDVKDLKEQVSQIC